MNVVLYSIGCSRCNVLEAKLRKAGIEFEKVTDKDYMISLGLDAMPVLEIDGIRMTYSDAIQWINWLTETEGAGII